MRPEHLHYDYIEAWFRESIAEGRDFLFDTVAFQLELRRLGEEYKFPYDSLISFIRNLHVIHIKRTAPKVKAKLSTYLKDYTTGKCTIKELARQANYPPALFARFVVEVVMNTTTSAGGTTTGTNKKSLITQAMRDPVKLLSSLDAILPEFHASEKLDGKVALKEQADSICTTRLAREVKQAIDSDPLHGPLHERERHFVGIEYEVVLEYQLKKLNLPFETEKELQARGTSKTPDILLTAPVAIKLPKNTIHGLDADDEDDDDNDNIDEKEWKVICWIDSKALFGDENTHRTSVLPQAQSYVHRFGPGLVLYWFGHAPTDRLGDCQGDIVIGGWELPSTFMLPTGEIVRKSSAARKRTK